MEIGGTIDDDLVHFRVGHSCVDTSSNCFRKVMRLEHDDKMYQ